MKERPGRNKKLAYLILLALTLYCRSALAEDVVVVADDADPLVPAEEEEEPVVPSGTECLPVTGLTDLDWTDQLAYDCCKDTVTADGGLFYSVEYYTCICSVFEFHFGTDGFNYLYYCSDPTFLTIPGWQTIDCDLV